MALGATMQLPERDRVHLQRTTMIGNLKVLYAGRISEQVFCNDVTTGAANDIERATDLVRRMVCEWGMSENVGPINYSESEETLFLGREVTRSRNHSEALSLRIDEEVRRIVDECYQGAQRLIEEHRDAVARVAEALIIKETLSGEEVDQLVKGELLPEELSEGEAPGPEV
jgi:cell division protease FtsH